MAKFAVGYINFYDNDLSIEIVDAADWKHALLAHSKIGHTNENVDWLFKSIDLSESTLSLEKVKEYAFDGDMAIDVVEIK